MKYYTQKILFLSNTLERKRRASSNFMSPSKQLFSKFTYIFGIWILSASFCLPKSCQGRDLGGFGFGFGFVAPADTRLLRCTCACAWLCCS